MSSSRLSIIVPTADGEGLDTLFASVADQLLPNDEIIVIGDTHDGAHTLDRVSMEVRGAGYAYCELDAHHHCWGHCQINHGITQASGDYLIFIDDDDCFPDGALVAIRAAIADQPEPRPLMFKFWSRRHGRTLPPGHYIQESAIGGHAMVVPNLPERLGRWECRYAGDFDFIQSTLALWPAGPAWYDDVIACA
jgi:glycosyltransferase involved in cell wall biosynthesis